MEPAPVCYLADVVYLSSAILLMRTRFEVFVHASSIAIEVSEYYAGKVRKLPFWRGNAHLEPGILQNAI